MASAALGTAYRHLRDLFAAGSTLGLEDGQLLARYSRSRDPAAFEALVGRHGPMVLATCRAVLKNEQDVEDAFQATFLVLARKAGSIRGGEALGGWLHRVAYRASVQASIERTRRRQKEAEAALAKARPSPTETDLLARLHREVDRLPSPQRRAVVLCDLEGLTYEEAAHQLGWTVPKLRHRLAEGRKRLKDRLARWGVAPLAAGSKLGAALPPALVRLAVGSASGVAPSAGVALLTHTLMKGMLVTKLKIASTATLAALALGTAGLIATRAAQIEEPKLAMKLAGQAQTQVAVPEAAKPAEMIEIKGVVAAPDGKPVEGAKVWLPSFRPDDEAPLVTTSGPGGRFTLRVPASVREGLSPEYADRYPKLVATAPGFAPGWTLGAFRPDAPAERTITLTAAGPPIEGRIVDLEGRPVAGARVAMTHLWYPEVGDLASWIASAKVGGVRGLWSGLENLSIDPPSAATTDLDGRFRLDGPGPNRVAGLLLSGPTVATETLHVLGHDAPEVQALDKSWMEPRPLVIHPPRFQHASAPSRLIEGTFRDKDTGKPIAGVRIKANVDREGDHTMIDGIEATTDAQGHYRLTGLPKAAGYLLFAFPGDGIPYTNALFSVAASSPGMGPIAHDLTLKRGVMVRGRITDKSTGKPVRGSMDAYTFADNPLAAQFPGYDQSYPTRGTVKDDGRFEVVALPGRGIIAVRSDDAIYRSGAGIETVRGRRVTQGGLDAFDTKPQYCDVGYYHAFRGIDLDPAAGSATVDLEVDPGRSVRITGLDPEGRPVGGTKVQGMGDVPAHPRDQASPTFEVRALDPSRPRRVTIEHEGRKLIGSVYLKGDESGELTVRLQPWGTLSGRVVDADGKPLRGITLFSPGGIKVEHPEEQGHLHGRVRNNPITTDGDGRFLAERLAAGLKYGAYASDGPRGLGILFEDQVVAGGEARDLGDLKVILFKP